jgi:hypothetical protein
MLSPMHRCFAGRRNATLRFGRRATKESRGRMAYFIDCAGWVTDHGGRAGFGRCRWRNALSPESRNGRADRHISFRASARAESPDRYHHSCAKLCVSVRHAQCARLQPSARRSQGNYRRGTHRIPGNFLRAHRIDVLVHAARQHGARKGRQARCFCRLRCSRMRDRAIKQRARTTDAKSRSVIGLARCNDHAG